MICDTRPSRFSACNIEKLGMVWGRGYISLVIMWKGNEPVNWKRAAPRRGSTGVACRPGRAAPAGYTYIYIHTNSERSEVSTGDAVDSIWLRKSSKMPLFTTRSSLVPSFTLRTSSWLSYPLVYRKWLQGNNWLKVGPIPWCTENGYKVTTGSKSDLPPRRRLRLKQISLSFFPHAIALFLV